jgi:hypothetical protein
MKLGISNPAKPISEMQIPKPNSIVVCGIFVLEENSAAAKIIIRNIGIIYSKVRAFPPWLGPPITLLLAATIDRANSAAISTFNNSYSDSIII